MKIYIYITRSITNPVCIYIYEYYEFQWQTRSITNRKHPSFSRLTARCITSVTSLSASIRLSIFIIQGSGFKIASCKICFMFCDISPTELLSQPHLAMITVCNPLFFFCFFFYHTFLCLHSTCCKGLYEIMNLFKLTEMLSELNRRIPGVHGIYNLSHTTLSGLITVGTWSHDST